MACKWRNKTQKNIRNRMDDGSGRTIIVNAKKTRIVSRRRLEVVCMPYASE